jgi:hypothetical protein
MTRLELSDGCFEAFEMSAERLQVPDPLPIEVSQGAHSTETLNRPTCFVPTPNWRFVSTRDAHRCRMMGAVALRVCFVWQDLRYEVARALDALDRSDASLAAARLRLSRPISAPLAAPGPTPAATPQAPVPASPPARPNPGSATARGGHGPNKPAGGSVDLPEF